MILQRNMHENQERLNENGQRWYLHVISLVLDGTELHKTS